MEGKNNRYFLLITILLVLISGISVFTLRKVILLEGYIVENNFPNQEAVSQNNATVSKDDTLQVLTPSDDDQFCLGDPIEIRFQAPEPTEIVRLWKVTNLGSGGFNLGDYRPLYFEDGDEHIVYWDQKIARTGKFVEPSYAYQLKVETAEASGRSGIFAIIDCNLDL